MHMLVLKTHRLVISETKTAAHHASTILPLDDGRVLCAWFGGSREGADDVGIWLSEKNGNRFEEPRLIAGGDIPHWNPVLFQCADGRIQLFYKVGKKIPDWRTMVIESTDGGRTFSTPRELVPGDVSGGRGPVRNKPIRLPSGRLLAPASVERGAWRCFIDISDDDGRTWHKSALIEVPGLEEYESRLLTWLKNPGAERPADLPHGRGIIQPTLWTDDKDIIHAYMRSGEGFIYESSSSDSGNTWSVPRPTTIPNNNSGIDLTRLDDGSLLLAHNPVQESWGLRSPLSLSLSKDNGCTWERLCDLECEPGEFSYPAIVSKGNRIHITYTWKRENIAYWEFEWKA